MKRLQKLKIGDIIEIKLSDNKKCYGQFVYQDSIGPIIRIFNYFIASQNEPDMRKINPNNLLFPPIHVGLVAAIKSKEWEIIGNSPTNDYIYEGFLTCVSDVKTHGIKKWFFWNDKELIDVGSVLPQKYRHLEHRAVYPADMVLERIETGFNKYELAKKFNRFLTKEEIKKKFPKVKSD